MVLPDSVAVPRRTRTPATTLLITRDMRCSFLNLFHPHTRHGPRAGTHSELAEVALLAVGPLRRDPELPRAPGRLFGNIGTELRKQRDVARHVVDVLVAPACHFRDALSEIDLRVAAGCRPLAGVHQHVDDDRAAAERIDDPLHVTGHDLAFAA